MILRVVLVAIALTVAAGAEQFKSGVDAVYMDVTVQAPDGSIVRGLTKDDFQVYEENVPQDVAVFSAEPAPISVGVLIDTSGSMTGERIAAAIRAAVGRVVHGVLDKVTRDVVQLGGVRLQ